MKLYYLVRTGRVYWDEAEAFVVRAKSKKAAREIAAKRCGDEGKDTWLEEGKSTIEELTASGEEGIIIRDFLNG